MLFGINSALGQAPVNTIMWSETWTGATTATSADANATPSANYGAGTTVYGSGTVTYAQSANSVYVRNDELAGGSKPELLLTGSQTWTISNIPTGNATELSLTYKSNNTKSSVTCSTAGTSISGSSKSYVITTGGATTITLVFSASGNSRIDDVELKVKTPAGAETVAQPTFSLEGGYYNGAQTVTITTNAAGGTTYYTVDGTDPDDSSTPYTSPVSINETSTLKAITYKGGSASNITSATYNIFYVTDGEFDFVSAGEVGEDYGSGLSTTSDGSFYVEEAKTWTAGFVTMVTDGKYRWWNADKTLRFYGNTPKSSATFSVPDGSVIVNIKIEGGSNFTSTPAGLTSGTWTGASQTVKFEYNSTSGSANVKKFIVTYLPENVILFPAKEYTTYVTPAAMDFTGVSGLKAFVATAAASTGVTLTEPAAAVPAKTPLVLKKVSGTSFEVPVVASGTAPATNMLKAGPATMTGDGTEYILIDGLFYQSTAGALATGKAYLKTASALGRELTINWGDETAINALENATKIDNGAIYDLSGRRVENPTKGIYIMNGKKVIFK